MLDDNHPWTKLKLEICDKAVDKAVIFDKSVIYDKSFESNESFESFDIELSIQQRPRHNKVHNKVHNKEHNKEHKGTIHNKCTLKQCNIL